jgi:hypothetical protein
MLDGNLPETALPHWRERSYFRKANNGQSVGRLLPFSNAE